MSPSSAVTSSAFVPSPQRTRAKPSVAESRHRIEWRCRRFVRVRQPKVTRRPGHDLLDLAEREAGEPEIEVEVIQGEQLLAQQAHVPAGILGDLVVREDKALALRRGQVRQLDDRYLGHPELLGG